MKREGCPSVGAPPPDPPVPPACDLRKLPGFVLNAQRLLGSEFLALASGDEVKAALTLWCRAWHQVPAASLPDDDKVLASFAGLGSDLRRWAKIKPMALRGFVLCGDGRLYHTVLAAEALQAWDRSQAFQRKRETDADRLRNWRSSRSEARDETRFKPATKRASSQVIKEKEINPQTPLGDTPGSAAPSTDVTPIQETHRREVGRVSSALATLSRDPSREAELASLCDRLNAITGNPACAHPSGGSWSPLDVRRPGYSVSMACAIIAAGIQVNGSPRPVGATSSSAISIRLAAKSPMGYNKP